METSDIILITMVVFIIIIAIALIYAWFSLNAIVKAAIERYGSQVTHTTVRVSKVKITPTVGSSTISSLTVGNPPGFSGRNAIILDTISAKIDVSTLTQEPIAISQIIIHSPQILFEVNQSGKSNIDALRKNIAEAIQFDPPELKPGGKKESKLIIRQLIIEDGQIRAGITGLGKARLAGNLPRIELTDIGAKAGGLSPREIAERIITMMVNPVGSAASELRTHVEDFLHNKFKEFGK